MGVPTKLEKLLIGEVSGVDDPANQLPGWLTLKARAASEQPLPVGPDRPWDVEVAEARVRKATGAGSAPTEAYADCFLWHDPTEPNSFGSYRFLVVDEVDGHLALMPRALDAASKSLESSSVPAADQAQLRQLLARCEARVAKGNDGSLVGKIKLLLSGKEDLDMTKDELNAELDSRLGPISAALETLAKSVEVLPTALAPTPDPDPDPEQETVTEEEVTKRLADALAPFHEILEKVLDRLERTEKALAIRKSLDGQESVGDGGEPRKPTVSDAIGAALRGRKVELK